MFRPVKLPPQQHQQNEKHKVAISETAAACSPEAKSLRISGQQKTPQQLLGSTRLHSPPRIRNSANSTVIPQEYLPLNRISPLRQNVNAGSQKKLINNSSNNNDSPLPFAAVAVPQQPPQGTPMTPRTSARVVLDPIHHHSTQRSKDSSSHDEETILLATSTSRRNLFLPTKCKTPIMKRASSSPFKNNNRNSIHDDSADHQNDNNNNNSSRQEQQQTKIPQRSVGSAPTSKNNNNVMKRSGMDVLFSLPVAHHHSLLLQQQQQQQNDDHQRNSRNEKNIEVKKKTDDGETKEDKNSMDSMTTQQHETMTKLMKSKQQQQQQSSEPRNDLVPMWKSSSNLMKKQSTTMASLSASSAAPTVTTPSKDKNQKLQTILSSPPVPVAAAAVPKATVQQTPKEPERKMTFSEYVAAQKKFDSDKQKLIKDEESQRISISKEEDSEKQEISTYEIEHKQFERLMNQLERERRRSSVSTASSSSSSSSIPPASASVSATNDNNNINKRSSVVTFSTYVNNSTSGADEHQVDKQKTEKQEAEQAKKNEKTNSWPVPVPALTTDENHHQDQQQQQQTTEEDKDEFDGKPMESARSHQTNKNSTPRRTSIEEQQPQNQQTQSTKDQTPQDDIFHGGENNTVAVDIHPEKENEKENENDEQHQQQTTTTHDEEKEDAERRRNSLVVEMSSNEAMSAALNLVSECSFIPDAEDYEKFQDEEEAVTSLKIEEENNNNNNKTKSLLHEGDEKKKDDETVDITEADNNNNVHQVQVNEEKCEEPADADCKKSDEIADGEDMSEDDGPTSFFSSTMNPFKVSFVNVNNNNDNDDEENNKKNNSEEQKSSSSSSNVEENPKEEVEDPLLASSITAAAASTWKPLVKKKVFTPLGDRVFDDQEQAELTVQASSLPLYEVFRAEIRNGRRRWLCGDPILVSRILSFVFGGPLSSRDQYPDGPAMLELSNKYVELMKEHVVAAVLLAFLPEGDLSDTRHPVVRILMHSLVKRHFEDFNEFATNWKNQAALHRHLSNPRAQHAFRTPSGLLFSGAFDGGNLSHVEQHPGLFGSPPVYQAWITSDAEMVSGFRFWFQFTITNLHLVPNLHERQECLCIRIMNVIFRESFDHIEKVRPVWSSDTAPLEWHPCAEARIDYERKATECRMSFYIPPTYPADTQVLHVAFNVPYNVGSLSRSIIHWDTMAQMEQNKKYVKFQSSVLTKSTDGRPIYCMEITGSAKMQRRRQRSVFITGRANAGDHSASHALHAIISYLLFDRSYNAKHLRECFTFYICPMINPDGIARGHSRLDGRGENLNTTYDLPNSKRHPAQHAFEYKFWKTHRQFGRPAMYVDLQSQIPTSRCFIYGNPGGVNGAEGSFDLAQHGLIFARAFERNVPKGTFAAESCFLPLQALDEISGSSRRHYGPHVEHCYTFHVPHIYDSQVNHSGCSLWHPKIEHEKSAADASSSSFSSDSNNNINSDLSSVPIVKMFADYGRGVLMALAEITQILMTPKDPPERPAIRGRRFGGYIKEYVTDPDLQDEIDAAAGADDPEGGSSIKFFKVAKSQLERDYVLLIDRSRSMTNGSRWADAENAVSLLAPQICEFDPDGITIIFFDHEPIKFENVQTGEEVKELFDRHPPRGTTDLALALDMAFVDHFSGYRGSTTILCITDGRPNNTDQVKEVITEAANTLGCDAELSISLVQIGANVKATQYLKELDDELEDAKYDIVDAITAEEVKDISFNELIARSMMD